MGGTSSTLPHKQDGTSKPKENTAVVSSKYWAPLDLGPEQNKDKGGENMENIEKDWRKHTSNEIAGKAKEYNVRKVKVLHV